MRDFDSVSALRSAVLAASLALAACGPGGVVSSGTPAVQRGSTSSSTTSSGTQGAATSSSSSTASSSSTSTSSTTTSTSTSTTGSTAGSTTSSSTSTSGTTGTDCCGGGCSTSCDPNACVCTSAQCEVGSADAIPTDAIDLHSVTFLNSPDVTSWPATTALSSVDVLNTGVHLVFDKQDGASRWPDYNAGAVGMVQYTLWLFENINGQWYASGGIRYAYGDYANGGAPSGYGANWFYDSGRWSAMANRQPAVGELVGFMVTAGDARDSDGTNLQERSNIVVVPFPADTGAAFACLPGQVGTTTGGTTSSGGTTGGGSTSGSSSGGSTSGGGTDCCNGACQAPAQFCDAQLCQCAAQGSFDLSRAQVYDSPGDIASWPVTTSINSLSISGSGGFAVTFDKQGTSCDYENGAQACDGSGAQPIDSSRWPDVCIPGWNGGNLQYTLWSVEFINGAWATSGPIEYWCGLPSSGGSPSGFAADWYYDSRWGPLMSYQPAVGEWVGFFVTAGNARNITSDDPSQSTVMERSNVVFVPFPADAPGSSYTF